MEDSELPEYRIRHQFIFTLVFHEKNYKKACDDTYTDFLNLINKIRNSNTAYQIKYGEKEDRLKLLESEEDYTNMQKSKDNKVFLVFNKNEGIVSMRKKLNINYRMHLMKKALSNMTHKRFERFNELSKRISQSREMIKFTPMKPNVFLSSSEMMHTLPKANAIQTADPTQSRIIDQKKQCDSCNKKIIGKLYLCAICQKFSMCSKCKKENEYEHDHHFFISIKNFKKFEKEKASQGAANDVPPNSSRNEKYKLSLADNTSFEKREAVSYGTQGDKNILFEINTNVPNNEIVLSRAENPPNSVKLGPLSWKVITFIRVDLKNIGQYTPGSYQQNLSISHKDSRGNQTLLTNNNLNVILDVI